MAGLVGDLYPFALMASMMLVVLVTTEGVLRQIRDHARSVPISLDFATVPGSLSCEARATASACAQFIKAGWSYGATWISLIVVTSVVAVLGVRFMLRMCRKPRTRVAVLGTMLLFAVGMIVHTESPGKLYDMTGNVTVGGALRRGVFDLVYPALGMTWPLDVSIRLASVFCAVAGVITAAACFSTVLDLPGKAGPGGAVPLALIGERMAQLSIRFYRLRILVALGAVFLVLGVFTTSGYLTWPASFVKAADRDTFKTLADGVLLVVGTEYTLLLFLGFFLPAGVIFLSARSMAVKSGASSQKQIDDYLAGFGLNFSFPSVLKDSLTVMAPFVASALVSAAKLVP